MKGWSTSQTSLQVVHVAIEAHEKFETFWPEREISSAEMNSMY